METLKRLIPLLLVTVMLLGLYWWQSRKPEPVDPTTEPVLQTTTASTTTQPATAPTTQPATPPITQPPTAPTEPPAPVLAVWV